MINENMWSPTEQKKNGGVGKETFIYIHDDGHGNTPAAYTKMTNQ